MRFEEERKEIFLKLLNQEYNGKKIWESIRDNELSATPAFEGSEYKESNTKIMFVGRALNGWDEQYKDCSSIELTYQSIIEQPQALDTIVDKRGFGNGKRKYYHKNSKFFRFIKHVLEEVNESGRDTDNTWYSGTDKWNQKFVWANLYCIAPRRPKHWSEANPKWKMIKPSIDEYILLMKKYILHYKPDVVIFITGLDWLNHGKDKSFTSIFDNCNICEKDNFIVATGNIENSRIIVCNRPDRIGTSYAQVKEQAKLVTKII